MSTLTDKGMETLRDSPERIREVNEELEDMGAEVIAQYALFGKFDFANILKVPDAETMARISSEMASRGTLRLQSYQALEVDDLISGMK